MRRGRLRRIREPEPVGLSPEHPCIGTNIGGPTARVIAETASVMISDVSGQPRTRHRPCSRGWPQPPRIGRAGRGRWRSAVVILCEDHVEQHQLPSPEDVPRTIPDLLAAQIRGGSAIPLSGRAIKAPDCDEESRWSGRSAERRCLNVRPRDRLRRYGAPPRWRRPYSWNDA